jgi:hypothetical protein
MKPERRERTVLWSPWDEPGLEHLHLVQTPEFARADSVILTVRGGMPLRLHYEVRVDETWACREVRVSIPIEGGGHLKLHADGDGLWTTDTGDRLPELDGCIDVDINATPFTNTLPIRRLGLAPGEWAEIDVAYILVPEMEVGAVRQRYTCIEQGEDGGRYKYEGLTSGFMAELRVDSDGLVLDYPEVFHRVWPLP